MPSFKLTQKHDALDETFLHLIIRSSTNAKITTKSIEIILASDLCNTELLEIKNNLGHNILHTILISHFVNEYKKLLIETFINNDHCTKAMVNDTNLEGKTPYILALETNMDIANSISRSDKFDDKVLKSKAMGVSYLTAAIKSGNLDCVKAVISMEGFTDDVYLNVDDDDNNCFHYAVCNLKSDKFEYLLDYETFDKNMLGKQSNSNIIPFTSAIINMPSLVIKMFEKNIINKELLKLKDPISNNSTFLTALLTKDDELIDAFLDSSYMDATIFTNGSNIFVHCQDFTDDILCKLIKSKFFDLTMVMDKYDESIDDNKIIHVMIILKQIKAVQTILKIGTPELLKLQGAAYTTLVLATAHAEIFDTILELPYLTYDCLEFTGEWVDNASCISQLIINGGMIPQLKKLLELDQCRSDLVNFKDNDEYTCLNYIDQLPFDTENDKEHLKEIIEILINTPKLDSNTVLNFDHDGLDFLSYMYTYAVGSLRTILKSRHMSTELLMKNFKSSSCIIISMMDLYNSDLDYTDIVTETFDELLSCKYCTNEVINCIPDNKHSYPIMNYCYKVDYFFKTLLTSKFDLTDTFIHLESIQKMRSFIKVLLVFKFELFKEFYTSKYFDSRYFLCGNNYKHNAVVALSQLNVDQLKYMLKETDVGQYIEDYGDIDNDRFVMFCLKNPDTVKYLIENDKCTQKMLTLQNNLGENTLHHCARNNCYDSFLVIVDSKQYDIEKLINIKNNMGYTVFHLALTKASRIAKWIIDNNYITSQMLNDNDQLKSILLTALENKLDIVKDILKSDLCTKDILMQKDNNNATCLMYANRYMDNMVVNILEHKNFDSSLLQCRDDTYNTCITNAAQYSAAALKLYLDRADIDEDLAYYNHMDLGSALTIAAKYQPFAVKYLLDWEKTTWKTFWCVDNEKTFCQIAAIYQPEAIKYAIESKWDLTEIFVRYMLSEDGEQPFLLACKYQPEAVKYILESKYYKDNIYLSNEDDKCCVHYAHECQPLAFLYLIKSNRVPRSLFDIPYDHGYKVISNVQQGLSQRVTLDNFESLVPICKIKNIVAKDDQNACSICQTYVPNICFNPCMHTMCSACAIRVKDCPNCRTSISAKSILYI